MIRNLLQKHLTTIEEILECDNGEKALQFFMDHRPDWVLMDIVLPGRDGLTVSQELLANFPDARIIICTNYDEPSYQEIAHQIGIRGFVLKENLFHILSIIKQMDKEDL